MLKRKLGPKILGIIQYYSASSYKQALKVLVKEFTSKHNVKQAIINAVAAAPTVRSGRDLDQFIKLVEIVRGIKNLIVVHGLEETLEDSVFRDIQKKFPDYAVRPFINSGKATNSRGNHSLLGFLKFLEKVLETNRSMFDLRGEQSTPRNDSGFNRGTPRSNYHKNNGHVNQVANAPSAPEPSNSNHKTNSTNSNSTDYLDRSNPYYSPPGPSGQSKPNGGKSGSPKSQGKPGSTNNYPSIEILMKKPCHYCNIHKHCGFFVLNLLITTECKSP